MPQPPGANQKNLYVKLFDGLLSADADRYIDLSSANATAFAKIIGTLVKCSDRNSMFYHMNGCKTDLALETNTAKVIDNGRIQCTATITDTSHTFSTSATNTLLYRVEMILVPQGQPSNDWKVVGAKIESHTPASAVQSAGGGAISTDEQLSKLSGHWRLTSESNGKLPSPKVYILQVDGPAITIGAPGGGKGIHYIDGRPSVYPSGSTVSSSTRWSGGVLVIDISSSSSNGTATQFRVSYSVSNDARTLTRHLQQLAAGRTVLENIAVYSKE
jgi:hypothetical protein